MFVSLPSIGLGKSLCYMLLPLVFDYIAVESGSGKAIAVFSPHRPDGRTGGVLQCQSCPY